MEAYYRRVAQLFSMVSLGMVPPVRSWGLCSNVLPWLYGMDAVMEYGRRKPGINGIQTEMKAQFLRLGLDADFPVEGTKRLYDSYGDKYSTMCTGSREEYVILRRALAHNLAQHFWRLANGG